MQGKISFRIKIITARDKKQSARLKTGKIPILIKSLTPSKKILSTRFPSVPARKRTKTRSFRCFSLQRKTKSQIPRKEIKITIGR
jgi:hypothetical protein